MRALFIAAVLAAGPALSAEMVAKQGDDQVRLVDAPCPYASVLRFIPEEARKEFRKADARIGGQRWFACFRVVNSTVHLVYEDGDQGLISVGEFKTDPGA